MVSACIVRHLLCIFSVIVTVIIIIITTISLCWFIEMAFSPPPRFPFSGSAAAGERLGGAQPPQVPPSSPPPVLPAWQGEDGRNWDGKAPRGTATGAAGTSTAGGGSPGEAMPRTQKGTGGFGTAALETEGVKRRRPCRVPRSLPLGGCKRRAVLGTAAIVGHGGAGTGGGSAAPAPHW